MKKATKISKTTLLILIILGVLVVSGIVGIGVGDAYWYGLTVDSVTKRNINYYRLDTSDAGVVVIDVKGDAEKAGVKEGDVITGINGMPIYDTGSFLAAARIAEESNGIVIDVERDGDPMRLFLSGFNAVNTDFKPVDLDLIPTDPFFLIGGTNPAANTNIPNSPAQSQTIPSEGLWLGMEIEQITPGGIRELNLPADQTGIIVDSAPVGSEAEKAGLKNGDIITSINGQAIVNMADYIRVTNNEKIETANLGIVRDGKQLFITIPPVPAVSEQVYTGTAPPITYDAVMPHAYRGVCVKCHQIVDKIIKPNAQIGNFNQPDLGLPSPAQQNAAQKVLVEGHWLGMELIPITPELARAYNLPNAVEGLLVDEVTLEAAESGLLAGDVLQSINNYPIKTLEDFKLATEKVESLKEAHLGVLRKGKPIIIQLRSSWQKLGVSQNEAAQPIKPGAISPHNDKGRPCTACHIIMQNGGQLPTDAGDILPSPPPITKNARAPHSYRGKCNVCHIITNK